MSFSYRVLAIVSAALSATGIALSVELTRIHVLVHTDPEYHSVCAVSEGINCETVAHSPYSVFAGVPVSVWGIVCYLGIAILSFGGASRRRFHDTWPWGVLFVAAAAASFASAVLAIVSIVKIDSLCLFCMGTYIVNAGLLAAAVLARFRSREKLGRLILRDLQALFSRPALSIALVAAAAATIGTLVAAVPAYWRNPEWTALPISDFGTDEGGGHWVGAKRPEVTVVEFSDYQCPHCRIAHAQIREIVASDPNRIRLVHRHLPLDDACNPMVGRPFHLRACDFAHAAECAGAQGKFWEMNDALFALQNETSGQSADLLTLAVKLGLDRSRFKSCIESKEGMPRVLSDIRAAGALGIKGTPTFVVGDDIFVGHIPKRAIERLLGDGDSELGGES